MDIQIRQATKDDLKTVGDLFAEHLNEQFSIDPYAAPNNAFDPHWFIEAMMNPPINHIILADVDDRTAGFARLGILYGEGLIPLGGPVKRSESNYIKRLPMVVLGKFRNLMDVLISRIEKRRTVGQIALSTRRGYIADLYIIPEMRRKGVGGALTRVGMEWFASQGVLMTDLSYLAANEAGKAFWKAMGFGDYRVTARRTIR